MSIHSLRLLGKLAKLVIVFLLWYVCSPISGPDIRLSSGTKLQLQYVLIYILYLACGRLIVKNDTIIIYGGIVIQYVNKFKHVNMLVIVNSVDHSPCRKSDQL